MDNKNVIKAALIGLGGIAWKYDARRPGLKWPLSQAGAMLRDRRIRILGGCSPDRKDRKDFSVWLGGAAAFADAEDMLKRLKPDLVGICSPTECHYEHARLCMEAGVQSIWLEKPPAASLAELRDLAMLSEERGCMVGVDYIRRYMPSCRQMRDMIRNNVYGKCLQFIMRYSPGLVRNGSHLLDLCFFLSGASGSRLLWVEEGETAAPAFAALLDTGQLVIAGKGNMPYHTNDLCAVCESGVITMRRGGKVFREERMIENPLHPGFHELQEVEPTVLNSGANAAHMVNSLEDLLECGESGRQPAASLKSCLLSQELLEHILGGAEK